MCRSDGQGPEQGEGVLADLARGPRGQLREAAWRHTDVSGARQAVHSGWHGSRCHGGRSCAADARSEGWRKGRRQRLLPEDDQHDIACEGFGNSDFVKGEVAQATDGRKVYRQDDYDRSGNVYLGRRVQFKPMLGLFNQEKLIPLRYGPIQIELELVNSQADAVYFETSEGGFQNGVKWDISDIQCKCDLLELDSSLSNEYASHLLS